MPPWGPISRRDLVAGPARLGFSGPFTGGKHQYMIRIPTRVYVPNSHQGDIGVAFLSRILRQAGIDRETWEKV